MSWTHLPTALDDGSGSLLPHMSARLRREIVDAVFHGVGGPERLRAWVEKSDENYKVFLTQVWAPGQAKATNVAIGVSEGVEAMLEKLDRAENAKLIDGEVVETS